MAARLIIWLMPIFLLACTSMPKGITPVTGFDSEAYLGTWYEAARLDHRFERGLDNVTAVYSKREDGGVSVVNRGFNAKKGEWQTAEGKAYFVSGADVGHLKVSFFGPFYASYVIFDIDGPDYSRAYVSGHNTSYLWLLSRTPTVSAAEKQAFIASAKAKGFDTDALIWVNQDKN